MTSSTDAVTGSDFPAPGDDQDEREVARRRFAEDFGIHWELGGSSRMEGRVIGYLMVMRHPYISLAELAEVLKASVGSISSATRSLVDMGFIKRHVIAGDRSHYFRGEDDMWGSWLAGERKYLDRHRDVLSAGIRIVQDSDDPGDQAARRRLENGSDYMVWLASYHKQMLADWEVYKEQRRLGAEPSPRADQQND